MDFVSHMEIALDEARAAAKRGEVPVGAVLVAPDGRVVAQAGNRTRELNDPSAHADVFCALVVQLIINNKTSVVANFFMCVVL